jgi:hypothetical protein
MGREDRKLLHPPKNSWCSIYLIAQSQKATFRLAGFHVPATASHALIVISINCNHSFQHNRVVQQSRGMATEKQSKALSRLHRIL